MTQTSHHDDVALPRPALLSAAVLIVVTIMAAAYGHWVSPPAGDRGDSTVIQERRLNFADRDDGAVVVLDVDQQAPVATLAAGTNGFLRGVLRGLVRERRARGLGVDSPFVLTRWSDDHLTLTDGATGRRIELRAFGPTNEQAFRVLLGGKRGDGLRTAARE
jgi:putative photosynthetic complex assembly protein